MSINPLRNLFNKIKMIIFPPMLPKEKTSETVANILNFIAKEKRPFALNRRIVHLNLQKNFPKKFKKESSVKKIAKILHAWARDLKFLV